MPPPLQLVQTNEKWEVLALDMVHVLPETSAGNRYMLIMTDLFANYVFLWALKDNTAKSVSSAVSDLFHSFGPPQRIISEQGSRFVNAVSPRPFNGIFSSS